MIAPTVGRKVWFRLNGAKVAQFGLPNPYLMGDQPMDATVVFVHNDRKVNLLVVDHIGVIYPVRDVLMIQGDESYKPEGAYCEWMPYQAAQAAKEAAREAIKEVAKYQKTDEVEA